MPVELKPLQALTLLRTLSLAQVQDEMPDLTTRQAAILLTIYLEPPPHTVRGLAAKLDVTKPVITRALDTMGTLDLVSRHRDEKDRRNVLVKRTVTGALYVERLGDLVIANARGVTIVSMLDRRLNAYRPDLADERLNGQVEAGRFTAGKLMQVSNSVVDLRAEPRPDSGPQTQIIFGDMVRVFEEQDGWCWVQAERDGYTGYVSAASLTKPVGEPTHMVIVPRTFVYPGNDLRFPHTKALSLGSRVRITGTSEKRGTEYALLESGEALIAKHLAPLGEHATDFVSIAETLLHTPYLWGGTSGFGIDCSGLVQLSMWVAGGSVLRDSDMQENSLGDIIEPDADYSNLKRGDLVFWKGHVAICESPEMLLHASGHTMIVTLEPLKDAIKRIAYLYDLPTLIRRP